MANANRDDNGYPILVGASSTDKVTPIRARTDPVTGKVLMSIKSTSYSATTKAPVSDDNAVRVKTTATNNAARTPKALLSDPNNPGYVLADVTIV